MDLSTDFFSIFCKNYSKSLKSFDLSFEALYQELISKPLIDSERYKIRFHCSGSKFQFKKMSYTHFQK